MQRVLICSVILAIGAGLGCTADPVNIGNDDDGGSGQGPGTGGSLPGGGPSTGGLISPGTGGTAGAEMTGGQPTSGGSSSGGTIDIETGGRSESGGATLGGASGIGGRSGTGGAESTGGTRTGGAASTGGAPSGGTAGAGGSIVTQPTPGQEILFEMAYSNFAWGPRSEGLYVTADGSVYSYVTPLEEDAELGDLLVRKDEMTLEEVTAKYQPAPELIATVPESELLARFARVGEARSGNLVVGYCCADAGEGEYVAWLYDPASSMYTPVLLGADGDTCVKNQSAVADELIEWLISLHPAGGGERICMFESVACSGATCEIEPPTCTGASRPAVVDGCWGDCVPPSQCDEVSTCDDCSEGEICVRTEDGRSHCSLAGCTYETCPTTFACGRTSEEVSCDCAGDRICAGGRAACRGSVAEGFHCVAP